jgi:hypothetical protein
MSVSLPNRTAMVTPIPRTLLRCSATLIIVPLALLEHWYEQIMRHLGLEYLVDNVEIKPENRNIATGNILGTSLTDEEDFVLHANRGRSTDGIVYIDGLGDIMDIKPPISRLIASSKESLLATKSTMKDIFLGNYSIVITTIERCAAEQQLISSFTYPTSISSSSSKQNSSSKSPSVSTSNPVEYKSLLSSYYWLRVIVDEGHELGRSMHPTQGKMGENTPSSKRSKSVSSNAASGYDGTNSWGTRADEIQSVTSSSVSRGSGAATATAVVPGTPTAPNVAQMQSNTDNDNMDAVSVITTATNSSSNPAATPVIRKKKKLDPNAAAERKHNIMLTFATQFLANHISAERRWIMSGTPTTGAYSEIGLMQLFYILSFLQHPKYLYPKYTIPPDAVNNSPPTPLLLKIEKLETSVSGKKKRVTISVEEKDKSLGSNLQFLSTPNKNETPEKNKLANGKGDNDNADLFKRQYEDDQKQFEYSENYWKNTIIKPCLEQSTNAWAHIISLLHQILVRHTKVSAN